MSKIFVVYGHHNIDKSFNQEIRVTFCSEAKKLGHEIENGKMMFIYQACAAFERWHNIRPRIDTKTEELLD